MQMRNLYKKDLKGVIHNHCSDYSPDATESFNLMVKNAAKAGLDFIIFTDHNSVGLKNGNKDLNYNGLQVIAGTEITPECEFVRFEDKEKEEDLSTGHFLIFDLEKLPGKKLIKEGICQKLVDFAHRRRLHCFIAHPDHKGTKKFGVPSYRCKNFDIKGYTGFSLWDLQTDWQNYATSISTALTGMFFPAFVLKGPEKETISRWDELAQHKTYSIIGELDQHAYKYKFHGISFTIFKSSFTFKTIRTHIVLRKSVSIEDDFKKEVLEALGNGHAYVSCDYFNDATNFIFEARHKYKRYIMGDTIKLEDGDILFDVKTPAKAVMRIIKDGKLCLQHKGDSFSFVIEEKGAYRVEIFKRSFFKLRPWIYSNTIRVT
jgi:hypothetical protein